MLCNVRRLNSVRACAAATLSSAHFLRYLTCIFSSFSVGACASDRTEWEWIARLASCLATCTHTYVYIIIAMPFLACLPFPALHIVHEISCGGNGRPTGVRSCSNRIYSSRVSKKTDCIVYADTDTHDDDAMLTSVQPKCFQKNCFYRCHCLHSLEWPNTREIQSLS